MNTEPYRGYEPEDESHSLDIWADYKQEFLEWLGMSERDAQNVLTDKELNQHFNEFEDIIIQEMKEDAAADQYQ